MTVSLSSAESHFSLKFPRCSTWSLPTLIHVWCWCPAVPSARQVFQETPLLFTDQSQTHQNAVNEHFPPSGLHLPAPVVSAQRAGDAAEWGEAGHWGGKAVRVGIRLSFRLSRLNEIDSLRGCFFFFPSPFCRVFLKNASEDS